MREFVFPLIKRKLTFLGPAPGDVILREMMQWSRNVRQVTDKPAVIIDETQEFPDISGVLWRWFSELGLTRRRKSDALGT